VFLSFRIAKYTAKAICFTSQRYRWARVTVRAGIDFTWYSDVKLRMFKEVIQAASAMYPV